ncbi:H+/Cl- antiporter ClcA [Nocardioides daedukensis]|uniref:H+/Cl- antiporter ClcA n=1 Tax=Nocardioides daedukensis TaxID=634462 RepID=A0A7Y9UNF6_9ACTN|nr:hypothetical protein [Nocardioides daedukensis]NYG57117.1 H+/Cl- antiporter ClcA [Nocardioides daedukensis]
MELPQNTNRAEAPRPTWIRALILIIGVVVSAAIGYATALAVAIFAVLVGAAPLLAGESTPQQPWVTPVAVCAGLLVFGLGVWLTVRAFRRR